jgi:hypothetical protein
LELKIDDGKCAEEFVSSRIACVFCSLIVERIVEAGIGFKSRIVRDSRVADVGDSSSSVHIPSYWYLFGISALFIKFLGFVFLQRALSFRKYGSYTAL